MTATLDIILSAVYLAVGTALFAAAVILAVLFHYRITPRIPRIRHNNNWFPPAPINYVIPQQPPPAHFYPPIPPRPPTVNEYPGIIHGRDEEDVPGEVEIGVQEGSDGGIARARLPDIQLSPDISHHSSASATLHPESNYPTAADLARYLIRLGLGTAGPAGSPATEQPASGHPGDSSVLPVTNDPHYIYVSSTTELDLIWDNLNIPHAAYLPRPAEDLTYGATAEFPSVIHWDEPVRIVTRSPTPPEPSSERTTELPLQWGQGRLDIPRRRREPPRSVIEVTEELNQSDRDRRQAERERAEAIRRVDEGHSGQRIPEVDSRGETVYHTPTDSVTSTERLPDEEYVNGILHGGSPSPSPVPSVSTPNTPPADHPDNHRTGPLPPVDG